MLGGGGAGGVGDGSWLGTVGGAVEPVVRAVPQFAQNRLPVGFDVPQLGHTITDYLRIVG
jgi:hypothetical protein